MDETGVQYLQSVVCSEIWKPRIAEGWSLGSCEKDNDVKNTRCLQRRSSDAMMDNGASLLVQSRINDKKSSMEIKALSSRNVDRTDKRLLKKQVIRTVEYEALEWEVTDVCMVLL
jgi:hypothetical protein